VFSQPGPDGTCNRMRWQLLDVCLGMQGFAPGALTEQPLSQRANAGVAITLAEEMGVYGFKPNVMDDIITGKRVSIRSSIAAFWRTVGGDISPLDLDIAMQMIYKLFTSEVCCLAGGAAVMWAWRTCWDSPLRPMKGAW
jgi:hypothetical protein